jgi:membrane-bound metal-dependent hydrolase YbcI (DUF457 family)
MPFTPLHMGPGLLLKAILHGSFSLLVFGWAQIVMDLQPLFVLISGAGRLHGFSHTYLGAALLAVLSALSGKYLAEFGLRIIGNARYADIRILWPVALVSALIGTFSHVALDSIMHADMTPYFPVSEDNQLLAVVSVDTLHKICIYTGIAGGAAYFLLDHLVVRRKKKWQNASVSDHTQ